MKRINLLIIATIIIGLNNLMAQRSNCSVSPELNTIIQKDKSKITLQAFGNEQEHYLETKEGYTVLANGEGIFEYAIIDNKGNLVPSGIKAVDKASFNGKTSTPKHLRYSKSQKAILAEIFAQLATKQALGKKSPQGFPNKGVRKVCVLLIQYPDLLATINKSVFENLFNQVNYLGTGSFKDYYLKTSYNQLTLNSDIYGWYMADNGYMFYGRSNPNYSANTRDLVRDAVVAADSAGVDFSQYDNDEDGEVDGLLLLHAGIGAEEQSAPNANNYIWSFRSSLGSGLSTNDGVGINNFCFFPEKRYNNATYSTVGIGVIVHEFGHLLDLPDLYSTQQNGEGSGNFTTMAGGGWLNGERTPSMFDAWTKIAMEWLEPTTISKNGVYTIKKAVVDSNFCYKIATTRDNEYFLLENRQQKGADRFIPGRGLAIWHINTNSALLLSEGGWSNRNNVNNDTSTYGTGLEQADGLRHLERATNRGDAGDLFPGTANNKNFNNNTNPSSRLHPDLPGGVRTPSNIAISNITINPDSSITFSLGNKATASYIVPNVNGCTPYKVQFDNKSTFADKYIWNFGDGSPEVNETSPTYTFTKQGTYQVKLYVLDSNNVKLDSTTKTFVIIEGPKAQAKIERLGSDSFLLTSLTTDADFVTWRFGNSSNGSQEPITYKSKNTGKVQGILIAVKGSCNDTFRFELDIWKTGINKFEDIENVRVFPNPFTKELRLDMESVTNGVAEIVTTNIIGQQIAVKKFDISKGKNSIDLSSLLEKQSNGTYFLTIHLNGSQFIFKALKNSDL
jgi:M6 family metalloprotease-like protein